MKKGFTLLEVVVAVTIFGLVALIIGSTLRLGIGAWEKGEASTGHDMRVRGLVERMSQQLKSAYPYDLVLRGRKVIAFQGGPESIWFVTAGAPRAYGTLKWVSYFIKDGRLMMNDGIVPDKRLAEKAFDQGVVLDETISRIGFSYLSLDGKEWKSAWNDTTQLPRAVFVATERLSFAVFMPTERPER
jgi:general secretion pathway protein J